MALPHIGWPNRLILGRDVRRTPCIVLVTLRGRWSPRPLPPTIVEGDMAGKLENNSVLTVQAPNGVVWTRKPGGRSNADDLLRELAELAKGHIEREWDWWEEDRRDKEHERQWAVLGEWDNGAVAPPGVDPAAAADAYMKDLQRQLEVERAEREVLAAERYDEARESLRPAACAPMTSTCASPRNRSMPKDWSQCICSTTPWAWARHSTTRSRAAGR
jgi:hypothetical protein